MWRRVVVVFALAQQRGKLWPSHSRVAPVLARVVHLSREMRSQIERNGITDS